MWKYKQKVQTLKKGSVLVGVVKKGVDMEIRWKLIEKQLSGACTNIMDIDNNLEPGLDGVDKHVESKNQADSATQIPKTSIESMKIVQVKFENTSAGLDIAFLAAKSPSQSISYREICYLSSY